MPPGLNFICFEKEIIQFLKWEEVEIEKEKLNKFIDCCINNKWVSIQINTKHQQLR